MGVAGAETLNNKLVTNLLKLYLWTVHGYKVNDFENPCNFNNFNLSS